MNNWHYLPSDSLQKLQRISALEDNLNIALSSEHEILYIIDQFFPSFTQHTPLGRGHDCAELVCSSSLALSTDFFWQDSHFRTSYFTPEEVGAKALGRAISDLAAAGAIPLGFSLGLMLPTSISKKALCLLFTGMSEMAQSCNIALTGGDLSRGERLGFCITVWGKSTKRNFFLKRKQAQQGDYIFVLGHLGFANAGFSLLEKYGREAIKLSPALCQAHLSMSPLINEGIKLAHIASSCPKARIGLMDLSDGILSDIPRLIEGYAANLTFGKEIIGEELQAYSHKYGYDAKSIILKGGEDYALLGTCSKEVYPIIEKELPNTKLLGEVKEGSGVYYKGKKIHLKGFDHFIL